MQAEYKPFIDWLKCLGITVIVYGHIAGWAPLVDLPPIYSEQLGVAFFLFATGYSLSAEVRSRRRAAFDRLFEIYLYGVPFAMLLNLGAFLVGARVQLSNYYPFLAGTNVLFNNFPSNPTTWYLGTYVHVIALWALVPRRIRVTPLLLATAFFVEVVLRAMLMLTAGRFVAYMLLPNWMTVFLLGIWHQQCHQEQPEEARAASWSSARWLALGCLATAVAGWIVVAQSLPFSRTLIWMTLSLQRPMMSAWLVSIMVSTLYVGVTQWVFYCVSALPAPRLVRFLARNTLLIFLVHMPLSYALDPFVAAWAPNPLVRAVVMMVICLPGLALLSEWLDTAIRPRELRDHLFQQLFRRPKRTTHGPGAVIPTT